VAALSGQARSLPQLAAAFGKMLKRVGDHGDGMVLPFVDSPLSVLNGRVREKRRFATQQFTMERLRTLARRRGHAQRRGAGASAAGAAALPGRARQLARGVADRGHSGVGAARRRRGHRQRHHLHHRHAGHRYRRIRWPSDFRPSARSVRHAKEHVQSLPRQAMEQYTLLLMAPTLLTLLTGVGGRTRPMFNITISNVPGPEQPLYFRGAELLATYPASIVTHGQAVNITCQSYNGR
jgi:diacylglycerol O-acyltransferase